METIALVLQLLILAGMGVTWWSARRDLLNLATTQQTPTLEKIETLKAAVDQLLDELDRKVAEIEQRLDAATALSQKVTKKAAQPREVRTAIPPPTELVAEPITLPPAVAEGKYGEVYALADAGLDADEIARKTGFGSAEVKMVISLRPVRGE